MLGRTRTWIGLLALLAAGFLGASDARAADGSNDYTTTVTNGLYEAPPATATGLGLNSAGLQKPGVTQELPFDFPFFGLTYDEVWVTTFGYVQFGSNANSFTWNALPSQIQAGNTGDGVCAPLWERLANVDGSNAVTWTAGTAPNRRAIFSWENVAVTNNTGAKITFQVKLYETSGRIEFAYKPDAAPTTWVSLNYTVGMVAPGVDPRWVTPEENVRSQNGHPGNDFRFDPRLIEVSGRVQYEKRTPTTNGLGTDTALSPLAGIRLSLEQPGGLPMATTITDTNGDFVFSSQAGYDGGNLTVVATPQGAACVVQANETAGPVRQAVATNIPPTTDSALGVQTIDATDDPTGAFRGPAHVAVAIERAHAWVTTRSTAPIPQLAVTYDPAVLTVTRYARAVSPATPTLTVAGPAATNDDTWDDSVVIRTYARHVLATLAASPSEAVDDTFDSASTEENAFAVGFGHAFFAAITGDRDWIDATGATAATTWDLEDPTLTVTRGPNVAGAVAAALYDLLDDANENIDRVDASNGGADRVLQTIEFADAALTASDFLLAWRDVGLDASAVSRVLIGNGVLLDDVHEPNDDVGESSDLGQLGDVASGLALTPENEDWFDIVVPAPVDRMDVELTFPRFTFISTVELEVRTLGGSLVVGKVDAGTGPIIVSTGALAAGTYRLHVNHVAGDAIPDYTLQTFEPLVLDRTPFKSWTVDFPYEQDFTLVGGIAPVDATITVGAIPPGIFFDPVTLRAAGTPSTVGTFDFSFEAVDSGSPEHRSLVQHRVVINPPLTFDLGEFMPFAIAKTTDLLRTTDGGTEPFAIELSGGQVLPDGIGVAGDALRFTGSATTAGSSPFLLTGVDVAGSQHEGGALAVVCVPLPAKKTPVDLAAGDSACGVFVDALAGSSISIGFGTAKKREKRLLRAILIGPDGLPVEGAKIKARKGKASLKATVPATGRYFAVVGSDDGGDTQLLASPKIKPPKKGKLAFDEAVSGDIIEIPIGVLQGARLRLKASPPKRTELTIDLLALLDPNGLPRATGDITSVKGSSLLVDTVLDVSGTWTVRLRMRGSGLGQVKAAYKLTQPKDVVFSVD